MVKVMNLDTAGRMPMGDRGHTIPLVNAEMGATALDVHVNVLRAAGPDGRYHYHPRSENVYVILKGSGTFVAEGQEYPVREHDVVFIPAGVKHSLSAGTDRELVLVEVYAPIPAEFVPVDTVKDGTHR
jgi:mannose-6-phosphate isomerase-like protein (cupin superfamily)